MWIRMVNHAEIEPAILANLACILQIYGERCRLAAWHTRNDSFLSRDLGLLNLHSLLLNDEALSVILGLHSILVRTTGLSSTGVEDRAKAVWCVEDVNGKSVVITILCEGEAYFHRSFLCRTVGCHYRTSGFC